MLQMLLYLYQNKLCFRLYLFTSPKAIPGSCTSSIPNILKFNGHDFITCPIFAHLSHYSDLFCEAMIDWVCIALQVNVACILTPIELCLTLTMFQKTRVSCHNLFLLGQRNPTAYSTLQEDGKISICVHFSFFLVDIICQGTQTWKSAPSPPQKSEVSSIFVPKFYWWYGISKKCSLNSRSLRELNLYGIFHFWANRPKYTN